MSQFLRALPKTILISVAIYFVIALGLVFSQRPKVLAEQKGLDFGEVQQGVAPDQTDAMTGFVARDGTELSVRVLGPDDGEPVVVVHGSGWHGGGYLDLAQHLAGQGYSVLVPDLRGHGVNPTRRGDVDHIGQLEQDLADLVDGFVPNNRKATFVGHSSGGGLVIRMAGGAYGDRVHRAVLIAPFLKYNAPTARALSGGWAHALTRRIIGLTMLNTAGIRWFNGLTVIQFNFPDLVLNGPEGATATRAYSYRLNTSFAPRSDYLSDIAKLPEFLLLVGDRDEAFVATAYEPLMKTATPRGTYIRVPGASHLGILRDKTAFAAMDAFLND